MCCLFIYFFVVQRYITLSIYISIYLYIYLSPLVPVNTNTAECNGPTDDRCTLNSTWRRRAKSADGEAEIVASPSAARRRTRHAARLNMGASTDDIHVCIMCMRAIMNNKVNISTNKKLLGHLGLQTAGPTKIKLGNYA